MIVELIATAVLSFDNGKCSSYMFKAAGIDLKLVV